MTEKKIPIDKLTQGITLEIVIVGYRGWLIRLEIAKWLIALAARIIGMNYKICEEESESA